MSYPNTSNFVKNTPLHVMFSTLFSVFGYPDETLSLMFDTLLQNRPLKKKLAFEKSSGYTCIINQATCN